MLSTNLRNSLVTLFNNIISVCGHPVHHTAHIIELIVAGLILFGVLHPTHAFELSHAGLFVANTVLGSLLKKHHHSQKA